MASSPGDGDGGREETGVVVYDDMVTSFVAEFECHHFVALRRGSECGLSVLA